MPPSDQSIKRAELYFDEILNQFKIQNFTTYDAKHKYLETYVIDFENGTKMPLKQLINDNPLLKEKIDSHMVHSVINEDGNPLTNQFDFSKEISDKKLFEALDKATELKTKYDSLGGANKEEELANASKTTAGRRLANKSNSLRNLSKAASGLLCLSTLSH